MNPRQQVDPFVRVNKAKLRPNTREALPRSHRAHVPVRARYEHSTAHPRALPKQPTPPQAILPPRPHTASQKPAEEQPKGRLRRIADTALQTFILLILLAIGFLARTSLFGEAIIIIYAVVALIIKIESRTTFLLALMSLGVVLIGSVRSDANLASTFAIYAFLLLIVGTISLSREVRDEI